MFVVVATNGFHGSVTGAMTPNGTNNSFNNEARPNSIYVNGGYDMQMGHKVQVLMLATLTSITKIQVSQATGLLPGLQMFTTLQVPSWRVPTY